MNSSELISPTHNVYIFDNQTDDYTSYLMTHIPIFKQSIIPNVPILHNEQTDIFIHYTLRSLLVLLHKLNIRPPR